MTSGLQAHDTGRRGPRAVIAFALAPLSAPIACAIALVADTLVRVLMGATSMPSARSVFDLLLAVGAVGVPLAYAGAILGGVPAYLVFRRLGIITRWTVWLGAAVIGTVIAVLLQPQLRGELFSLPFPWWVGAAIGIVAGEVFWRLLAMPNDRWPVPRAGTGDA